jgi:hypothetical protein
MNFTPFQYRQLMCQFVDNAGETGYYQRGLLIIQPVFAAIISAITGTIALFGAGFSWMSLAGEKTVERW